MKILSLIEDLLHYGLSCGMLGMADLCFVRNQLYSILHIDSNVYDIRPNGNHQGSLRSMEDILSSILDWTAETGLIPNRAPDFSDLMDAKIMGALLPRPSEIQKIFWGHYDHSPKLATAYLHKMSVASNYIRMDRIGKNQNWVYSSPYGALDITINLSKPEKDPKVIAAILESEQRRGQGGLNGSNYPECLICKENEGYEGHLNHPARQNLRLVGLNLAEETWYMQYSPYAYYSEHCIVLGQHHKPMKLTKKTFIRLIEFVELFPHYFIGSNADLPIVGGSILTHDHYQGGCYDFAMARAPIEKWYDVGEAFEVKVGRVHWPMSTLRISSPSPENLMAFAWHLYQSWQNYSDDKAGILCQTQLGQHNTITPVARKQGDEYQMDIVLRNNRTTVEHPDGLFHPHSELHHIKKENIGLIEVMGLAVLPGRLNQELDKILELLMVEAGRDALDADDDLKKHADWYESDLLKYRGCSREDMNHGLRIEVGKKFEQVLLDAGVFKRTELGMQQFDTFVEHLKV